MVRAAAGGGTDVLAADPEVMLQLSGGDVLGAVAREAKRRLDALR